MDILTGIAYTEEKFDKLAILPLCVKDTAHSFDTGLRRRPERWELDVGIIEMRPQRLIQVMGKRFWPYLSTLCKLGGLGVVMKNNSFQTFIIGTQGCLDNVGKVLATGIGTAKGIDHEELYWIAVNYISQTEETLREVETVREKRVPLLSLQHFVASHFSELRIFRDGGQREGESEVWLRHSTPNLLLGGVYMSDEWFYSGDALGQGFGIAARHPREAL